MDPKSELDNAPSLSFANTVVPEGLQYSTFGTFAIKHNKKNLQNLEHPSGPLINNTTGKMAIKSVCLLKYLILFIIYS